MMQISQSLLKEVLSASDTVNIIATIRNSRMTSKCFVNKKLNMQQTPLEVGHVNFLPLLSQADALNTYIYQRGIIHSLTSLLINSVLGHSNSL